MTTLPEPVQSPVELVASPADTASGGSGVQRWLSQTSGPIFSAYCIAAAFGTYFCMYGFRKPFTAASFEEFSWLGVQFKTVLITSQVAGYTLSKFIGIKVVSEIRPAWRAPGVLALIGIAELALLCFAITPPPYNMLFLFLNGLPLGIVFGLVLSFLEGRRFTEALSAGLCASFIVSSGVVKSIGKSLVQQYQVSEFWMPFLVGLMFVPPLLLCVWMLRQIPAPTAEDVALRSARQPMNKQLRWSLFWRHRWGLSGLVAIYVLLTIGRSIRDDFGVEIWQDLGYEKTPSVYARSETWVMFGVVFINGLAICIRSNRNAFLGALVLLVAGFATVIASLTLYSYDLVSPFVFMVLLGLGTYVPYVAFHTTVFERFIAAFREPGNIGYLMYLADATGYLAYVMVIVLRNLATGQIEYLQLLNRVSITMAIGSIAIASGLLITYYRKVPRTPPPAETLPEKGF